MLSENLLIFSCFVAFSNFADVPINFRIFFFMGGTEQNSEPPCYPSFLSQFANLICQETMTLLKVLKMQAVK